MALIQIKTPRGTLEQVQTKQGKIKVKLDWNPNFGAEKTRMFSQAQKMLDIEVLRTTTPYVPLRTGTLVRSGQLGTIPGEGEVNWIAPYASEQYYDTPQTRNYDPRRGGRWFDRAKANYKADWVRVAKRLGKGSV